MDRYAHHKAGKKQAERQEQERKEKKGSSAAPSKGEKKSNPPSTLAHDAEKASDALKEGEPVTMADVRAAAYFVGRAIRIVDEKGNIEMSWALKNLVPLFFYVLYVIQRED